MALLMLALAVVTVGVVGFYVPICCPVKVCGTDWAAIHFYDGRVRLFWLSSPEVPVSVQKYPFGPDVRVKSAFDEASRLPDDAAGPRLPRLASRIRVRVGDRWSVPDFGGRIRWKMGVMRSQVPPVNVSFVRVPVWLPVVLLLISPVQWVRRTLWVKRSRARRNECVQCGYSLKHLPEPRCPECGTAIPPEIAAA